MSTSPLRIVHCVRSPIGGIFRHIHDLAIAQSQAGHAVGVICDSSSGSDFDNAFVDRLRPHLALGVARFPMQRSLALQDLAAAFRLYRYVKDLKPDIVHGHGAKGGAYMRAIGTLLRLQGRDVTRIYCPHGGSLHYDPNRLEGRVYHALERLQAHFTDGLIFVSDYEYAAYETKVGHPRIPARVVYNGLQPSEFMPVQPDEDARDFLYIGMLRDLKGPDLFIEALYNLRLRTGQAPSAHIVGEGPDRAKYEQKVKDLGLTGAVTFHGALPARQAFRMGRCVVVPSRAEAMPYIVLETVAAQVPLIATRVGGIPEIFGRYASRLVEAGDVDKLTAAMEGALADPQAMRSFAKSLRTCLAETFSVDLMSDRITALYRQLRGQDIAGSEVTAQPAASAGMPDPQTVYASSSNP
ncbi:glycosyltransferase family 4 protein [Polymorphum gilvum]|uniref:Glycosyl transferase, group 1 family protein n=1 Tax=Polymorphum gilvum (strain LMG 25793 / CGMCC 1.9160 / SL003B-26A1) TaxID=991905 RepID=F2IWN5_POLGS|nr:glycosyltransferase family 4 protein [Polymorphum gilvum]ADZ70360.1 Glycosyl transferase, group 1 family protein [Polymorphum gilvum SL003B-26A1]